MMYKKLHLKFVSDKYKMDLVQQYEYIIIINDARNNNNNIIISVYIALYHALLKALLTYIKHVVCVHILKFMIHEYIFKDLD